MLLSVISLILLALTFSYCLFSFNIRKYYHVHLILIILLGGIAGSLYVCFTSYNWTKLEFNYTSIVFFIIVNTEFILLSVIGFFYKFKKTEKNKSDIIIDRSEANKSTHAFLICGHNTSNNIEETVVSIEDNIETEKKSDIVIDISEANKSTHAFLICAHNSSNNIEETVVSIKAFIHCKHIFIVDNGSTIEEQVKTKDICYKHDVNYIGVDKGNKTIAQLVGCFSLLKQGYKHVTICDDDLLLKKWNKQDVEKYFIDPTVKCVSYVILPSKQNTIINKFQRIEYAISSYMRLIQSKLLTCFFASGAISTWDIDIIIEVLLRHNGEFKGDDMRSGMILHTLQGKKYISDKKVHEISYKIKVSEIVIHTKVPVCCMHTYKNTCECGEPSLYHQRVKSWELSRYCFLFEYIKGIFQTDKMITRIIYLICIFSILVDIFTLISIGMTIYFAIYQPFYTVLLMWQTIAVNCLSSTMCWLFVINEIESIDVKWTIIMPFVYYFPNIFCIKLPSIINAMCYPFINIMKKPLYKRTDEWIKYV